VYFLTPFLTFSPRSDTLINRGKNKKIKEGKEDCVAKIERKTGQGKWFYYARSLVTVSHGLYDLLAAKLEMEIGKKVKKITSQKIRKNLKKFLDSEEFKKKKVKLGISDIEFTGGEKHTLVLSLLVSDVSFRTYANHVYANVTVFLLLPLIGGDSGTKGELTKKIAREAGLDHDCEGDGIKSSIMLYGENLPQQIPFPYDPNDGRPFRGNGRKAFVTEEEKRSNQYFLIA
jgi:hypothetical protein